jgi:hypothetical protein
MTATNPALGLSAASPVDLLEHAVRMYFGTRAPIRSLGTSELKGPHPTVLRGALLESRLLHTRQVVCILLSHASIPQHLRLTSIFPGVDKDVDIRQLLSDLRSAYGTKAKLNSPCALIAQELSGLTRQHLTPRHQHHPLNRLDELISSILRILAKRMSRPNLYPYAY